MSLSKHINPDRLLREAREHKKTTSLSALVQPDHGGNLNHPYAARYGTTSVPKYSIPSKGATADAVYQLIHDELTLDGVPTLNLASFVHTWMPPQADKLVRFSLVFSSQP